MLTCPACTPYASESLRCRQAQGCALQGCEPQRFGESSCAYISSFLQEKKAPKKAQGAKQPTTDKGQAQTQETDLIEDAQLPPSKKAMPVWPADSTLSSCLLFHCLLHHTAAVNTSQCLYDLGTRGRTWLKEPMHNMWTTSYGHRHRSSPHDEQSEARKGRCLQAGAPVRVHKPKEKSARWPRAWPAFMDLPDDCCPGDLVEVLETIQACHLTLTPPLWHLTDVLRSVSGVHPHLLYMRSDL